MFNVPKKENNLNNFKHYNHSVIINNESIVFESGKLAKKANGSILTTWGKSVVLTTVCMSKLLRMILIFFH